MNHSELKFQYVHISNCTSLTKSHFPYVTSPSAKLWCCACAIQSSDPVNVHWSVCRPPLHSKPKVQRHSMNLTSRHEICWTGDLFIWCEQTGVKTVLQNGYQNGTKNTMFIYELHRGKSTFWTQSDGGGWWTDDFPGINWVMKMVPVVTSRHKPLWHFECKTLSGTSTAFKPPKNPGKILSTFAKTCPPQKSSQSLSKCSKSWTMDQQPSLPKDRMAPVTLMAAWL